jgi:hypothetical protein
MQRGHAVNLSPGEAQRFAPIQFMHRTDAVRPEQPGDAGRNNELARSAMSQKAQDGKIQMIVMIVADHHEIDAGKILPPDARRATAARADPRQRTWPLGPNRIGQKVESVLLEQQRRVVDHRYP